MRIHTKFPDVPPHLTLKAIRLKQRLENRTVNAATLEADEVAIVVSELIRNRKLYCELPTREIGLWWSLYLELCEIGDPTVLMVKEWLVYGDGYLGNLMRRMAPEKRREAFRDAGCEYRGIAE